jgi:hypothetical protein
MTSVNNFYLQTTFKSLQFIGIYTYLWTTPNPIFYAIQTLSGRPKPGFFPGNYYILSPLQAGGPGPEQYMRYRADPFSKS